MDKIDTDEQIDYEQNERNERIELLEKFYSAARRGISVPRLSINTDINQLRMEYAIIEHKIQKERDAKTLNNMKMVIRDTVNRANEKLENDHPDIAELGRSALDSIDSIKPEDIFGPESFGNDHKLLGSLFMNTLLGYIGVNSGINFRWKADIHFEKYGVSWCSICKDRFKVNDLCRTPSCKHLFHAKCICRLEKENTQLKCPICLKPVIDVFSENTE